jgi:DNA-binding CsgD family transcriptional regulator
VEALVKRPDAPSSADPGDADTVAAQPALASDILYLIAALDRAEGLRPGHLSKLGRASAAVVHGDLPKALVLIDTILADPYLSAVTRDQVDALRLMTLSLIDEPAAYRTALGLVAPDFDASPAARSVAMCTVANRRWRAGDLAGGLWQNQLATNYATSTAPIWQSYAQVMLAKKLADLRITDRASDLVARVQSTYDNYGLHAFESIPVALRAALYLQRDNPEQALHFSTTAIEIAHQRGTTLAVPRALSVSAVAHLHLGHEVMASECLQLIRKQPDYFLLSDSVARAALVDIALTTLHDGHRAAVPRIRSFWQLLNTEAACFAEDPTMPAWLIGTAIRGGDRELAARIAAATEQLAKRNRGITTLEHATMHAKGVLTSDKVLLRSLLELSRDPHLRRRISGDIAEFGAEPTGRLPLSTPARTADTTRATGESHHAEAVRDHPANRRLHHGFADLTDRERDIALLVGEGLTNRQVARRVGVSDHTVNFHLRKIFRKLAISSRAELVRFIAHTEQQR